MKNFYTSATHPSSCDSLTKRWSCPERISSKHCRIDERVRGSRSGQVGVINNRTKNFGKVLRKVWKTRLRREFPATHETKSNDWKYKEIRCSLLRAEWRAVGGQSRNAYQTQLKSDDTVPVTAPPPPIKTTRARVSPRNSSRVLRLQDTTLFALTLALFLSRSLYRLGV